MKDYEFLFKILQKYDREDLIMRTKKIISLVLACVMAFTCLGLMAFAGGTHKVTFTDVADLSSSDFPNDSSYQKYKLSDYRTDWAASLRPNSAEENQGYHLGSEYWYEVYVKTDEGTNGTIVASYEVNKKTTITVEEGQYIEFTIETADYIEPQTASALYFNPSDVQDNIENKLYYTKQDCADNYGTTTYTPGAFNSKYTLAPAKDRTYAGIELNNDMIVCVNTFAMDNDKYIPNFPDNTNYSFKTVSYNPYGYVYYAVQDSSGNRSWMTKSEYEADPSKGTVVTTNGDGFNSVENVTFPYLDSTEEQQKNSELFFSLTVPKNLDYNYDSFQVYYIDYGEGSASDDKEKHYVKTETQTDSDNGTYKYGEDQYLDKYETGSSYVYIFKINSGSKLVYIHITGLIKLSPSNISDTVKDVINGDSDIKDVISGFDFENIINWFKKIWALIAKLIAAFK